MSLPLVTLESRNRGFDPGWPKVSLWLSLSQYNAVDYMANLSLYFYTHRFDVPNCEIWYIRFCLDQKMQVRTMPVLSQTSDQLPAAVGVGQSFA